jgi:hypothetical protein
MNSVLAILLPILIVMLLMRVVLAPSKTLASGFNAEAASLTVKRQRGSVFAAILTIVAPWPLMAKALGSTEEPAYAVWGLFIMMGMASCGGGFMLAMALRRVVVSIEGLQIVGFPAYQFKWNELRDIEARDNGSLGYLRFIFGKKRVYCDSTMNGFRELVRALEVWPTGNAKELGQKAARVLAQWREDPKSTKK